MSLFPAEPLCLHPTRTDEADNDCCSVHADLWNLWISSQTIETLLVEIVQENQRFVLTVDSPHTGERDTLYLPSRIFTELQGSRVTVTRLTELPPMATNIILQPLDTELYHCDIAGAVSEYLSHWNVLQKHTTLSVPCPELGGYCVDVFVQETEPADCVLLRGEVPLHLAESLLTVPEWGIPVPAPSERPSTPIPTEPEIFLPMVPPQPQPRGRGPPVFTPFSGAGRRLDGRI